MNWVFTVFFNRLAGIQSDGPPYPLFTYAGMILWTFFSNAVSAASNSLVSNQALVSKVYFPRVFIPVASALALMLDVAICSVLLVVLLILYRWPFGHGFILIPLYALGSLASATGIGLFLSALNVRFRDVKYVVPFFIQMGLFLTPVIYPATYLPPQYRWLLALNPMTGMVEGFRAATLGGATNWNTVGLSGMVCILICIVGLLVFKRQERFFADII